MSTKQQVMDVFLSHSTHDLAVAEFIRRAFEEVGLSVFSHGDLRPGRNFDDAIRDAIGECRAFVALLTPLSVGSTRLAVEYGGAWVWHKPVYFLLENVAHRDVPAYLKSKSHRFEPISGQPAIITEIARLTKPLSDTQRESLIRLYAEGNLSTDMLIFSPTDLEALTRRFNVISDSHISSDRVIHELVRLRKQGKLTRRKPEKVARGKSLLP
jgi:hypothetical protein